jgi:hypothetical protein
LFVIDALDHLGRVESELNPAIDRVCDLLTKGRGLLRLVRFDIGERAYRTEDERLREVLRLIDPIHNSGRLIARAEILSDNEEDRLDRLQSGVLIARLEARHLELAFALAQSSLLGEIESILRSSLLRIERLPVESDGFSGLRSGFEKIAEQGLRRMLEARVKPNGKKIFAWGRQVGFLESHIRFLSGAWPEVLNSFADETGRLVKILGEDRELGRLADAVLRDHSIAPKPVREPMIDLIGELRTRLLKQAWDLGARVHSEPPQHLAARIGRIWMQTES